MEWVNLWSHYHLPINYWDDSGDILECNWWSHGNLGKKPVKWDGNTWTVGCKAFKNWIVWHDIYEMIVGWFETTTGICVVIILGLFG